ncbi:MAG: hypothetical protein JRG91_05145 [Deltaproteobacteria bacterium]|nr:hypothetical protein [Deltaproteobacteria bacterium]
MAICVLAAACGPKPAPEAAGVGDPDQQVEPAPEPVDPEVEARIEKINSLVNEINAAIETQDAAKFWSVFTNETRDLFYKVATLDMAIAGIKDRSPADHVLQQQKDFDVVYTVEEVDAVEMTATLVGVMRGSGDEVRFPMTFIQGADAILIDYTVVLNERFLNLKTARMRSLVGELNRAVDEADVELFKSVLTDATVVGCPGFLHEVKAKGKKPPKIESILKSLQKKALVVELAEEDSETLSATLSVKVGDETVTLDVQFVFEEEMMRLDGSSACAPAE